VIRKFKESDIDQVIRIWLEASIEAHDFVDDNFWEPCVPKLDWTVFDVKFR